MGQNRDKELKWDDRERVKLETRILKLDDDQLVALFGLVGIYFAKKYIKNVLVEIRECKRESIHLDTLLSEANSKKNLIRWLDFFESNL